MKIKSLPSKRKYILIAVILVAAVATGAFAYAQTVINNDSATKIEETEQAGGVDYDDPMPDQVKAGNDKKNETIEKDAESPQPTTALNLSITASQQNGETVQIRTLIDNAVASGTCQLELTQGTKKITKSASLQALPSGSTCQGFDIPVSELDAGSWIISITATSGSASGNTKGMVTVTL